MSAPKRGRPSVLQSAAIVHNIHAVGCDLFLTNGYADTTMEAVAAAAGVSKGTLYARYPDKSTLFHAIVNERLEAWNALRPLELVDRVRTLPEQLIHFGRSFLASVREPEASAFHQLLASEAARFPELAKTFYENGFLVAVDRFATAIQKAAAAAGRPMNDPHAFAMAFNSALLGWIDAQRVLGEVTDERCEAFVSTLVRIFIDGAHAKG